MKHATTLLCACLLLVACSTLTAQQGDPDKQGPKILGSNAEGTSFIVGFMQNETAECVGVYPGDHYISVAARTETIIHIRYPDGTSSDRLVRENQIATINVSDRRYECIGEQVCDWTVTITSEKPVSVYCFSSKTHTSDGYLALPVSSWGTEYISANYLNDYYTPFREGFFDPCDVLSRRGEFAVIAAQDSTTVQVWPKVDTYGGGRAGQMMEKVLMRGEMWQIQNGDPERGRSDITGSRIISDKPVGMLSGHMRTAIPFELDTKDHLIEMLPPVPALGSRYIVVPFGGRKGGDLVRVITSESDRTNVTVSTATSRLNYPVDGVGSFQELDIGQGEVTVIETDKPALVAHYSRSNGVDFSSLFDPYMIVVTPEEQFVNSAVFQTMNNNPRKTKYWYIDAFGDTIGVDTVVNQFDQHFVTIVAERQESESLVLNDRQLLSHPGIVAQGFVPTLETEFFWVTVRLNGGESFTIEGEARFGGYVYGIGQYDSYGWPVGAGLRPLPIPDTDPPHIEAIPHCGGATYSITATDSAYIDTGLDKVWLDPEQSTNVEISDGGCVCGKSIYGFEVYLIDGTQPGHARIIAVDNAGNADTVDIDLRVIDPLLTENEIIFEKTELATLYTRDFGITNTYLSQDLRIDSIALLRGIEFRLVGMGTSGVIDQSIAPRATFEFKVSFITDEEGAFVDTLIIYTECGEYRVPVRATSLAPYIDTEDLDFGKRRRGKTRCMELTVTNTGDAELVIDDVLIDGANATFRFDNNSVPDLPLRLQPGESRVIIICFTPEQEKEFTGTVTFRSNAVGGKSVANLIGEGIYPKLNVAPYDFGDIQIGDTACTLVPIVNYGSDTAYLTGVTIPEGTFVADESIFDHKLPPGDTLFVPICFAPSKEQQYTSPILVDNEDGLEASNRLDGLGYLLLAEIDGYDWGKRWVGTSHDTIVHIRNLTDRPIEINSVSITGDVGDFEVRTQIPSGLVLNQNEEYPLEVRFTPMLRGHRSVDIIANTSSRVEPDIRNVLEGFGIQAIPGDELEHDFSTMYPCNPRTSRILIYNRGNAPLTIASIEIDDVAEVATLNAPNPGYQIPVGDDALELEVQFDLDGFTGSTSTTVSWSFEELPGEVFSRTILIEGEAQIYSIYAETPKQVGIGEEFDVEVTVEDEAIWEDLKHSDVMLTITYNPRVALFDVKRWKEAKNDPNDGWTFVGEPSFPRRDSGEVILRLRPEDGGEEVVQDVTFPSIPFRAYLGNLSVDTFGITMQADQKTCVMPAMTTLPYSIEDICGLNTRLIVLTGDPPALKPSEPNPATSTVTFEFTIPFEGKTELDLFSIDGKRIRRIISNTIPAGDHSVVVDVSDLPNGIYYYRLAYGLFRESHRLIIQR